MAIPQGNCPVCEKPFQPGDDIVICPECGAPYHRACWTKEGKCVFEEKHAEGFEYKAPARSNAAEAGAPEGGVPENGAAPAAKAAPNSAAGQTASGWKRAGMVCERCGTINDAENIFCEQCGLPLHQQAAPQFGEGSDQGGVGPNPLSDGQPFPNFSPPINMSGEVDGIPMQDWASYIGNNYPAYLYRLMQQQLQGTKVSFMLSAALLGPFYFAYRKMWGWAAAAFGVFVLLRIPNVLYIMAEAQNPLVAGVSLDTFNTVVTIASVLNLVVAILQGLFGMYLYRRNAAKKIHQLRGAITGEMEYRSALMRKGGINMVVPMLLFFLFSFVLYAVLGQDLASYSYGLF